MVIPIPPQPSKHSSLTSHPAHSLSSKRPPQIQTSSLYCKSQRKTAVSFSCSYLPQQFHSSSISKNMSLDDDSIRLKSASTASLSSTISHSQINKELPPLPKSSSSRSKKHSAVYRKASFNVPHENKNLKSISRLNHSSPQILQRPPSPASICSDDSSDSSDSYVMTLSPNNPFMLFNAETHTPILNHNIFETSHTNDGISPPSPANFISKTNQNTPPSRNIMHESQVYPESTINSCNLVPGFKDNTLRPINSTPRIQDEYIAPDEMVSFIFFFHF